MKDPDPSEVLTHADAGELPNGTATILTVADPDHKMKVTATIDETGYIRRLNRSRDYFPREWKVLNE